MACISPSGEFSWQKWGNPDLQLGLLATFLQVMRESICSYSCDKDLRLVAVGYGEKGHNKKVMSCLFILSQSEEQSSELHYVQ